MISSKLTSDDYHALGVLVLHELNSLKGNPFEKDSKKISYLNELKRKLEEYFYSAYNEENNIDEVTDDE